MIKRLANAKTDLYCQCKKLIYDANFPWYFTKRSIAPDLQYDRTKYKEISLFTHWLLGRPNSSTGHSYPIQQSEYLEHFERMLMEIFELNQIKIGCFFRVCLNLVYPSSGIQLSIPHQDHFYPHKNVLVYLTDSGGETYCEGDVHDPKEDDVIIFEGEHYHKLPENDARIVLVATYT